MNCDIRNIFVVVFNWRLHFPMSFSVWSWKLTIGLTTKHKDWNVYVFIISSRGNTQINISFLCLLYLLILLSLWLRWVNKKKLTRDWKETVLPHLCDVQYEEKNTLTLHSLTHSNTDNEQEWVADPSHLYLDTPSSGLKIRPRWQVIGARHARTPACWSNTLCTLRAL